MRLHDKNAIIYGAGGAIGGAVARAFAREGARVFLTGRDLGPLEAAAKEISAEGGFAEAAHVDALDAAAVREHADGVAHRHGGIDISFNAIGLPQAGIQGTALADLELDRFQAPIHAYLTSHFLTAQVAGRYMTRQGSGVIITLTAAPSRAAAPFVGGMAPAWAGVEALTRVLAAELGPQGVRVVCLRPDGIPETATIDVVYGLHAQALGITRAEFTDAMRERTLLKRLPTLADVAGGAVFLASADAAAMTGTVANLSGGSLVD
ncbi:short-chain dehydrogenase [Planotetraspora silvatica]|uniref:Short-chain dehydrogenase n=1 Tax=Planotetraspora silvatica TaxID=234614 RepID=A0A8J3UKC6_9ACTN|nr:SDR family oxidoreductase [Planotetraspora silvatica]GII47413.1 short-chain dehydrogenase [Planotetraspora silvatica]